MENIGKTFRAERTYTRQDARARVWTDPSSSVGCLLGEVEAQSEDRLLVPPQLVELTSVDAHNSVEPNWLDGDAVRDLGQKERVRFDEVIKSKDIVNPCYLVGNAIEHRVHTPWNDPAVSMLSLHGEGLP